MRKLKIGNMRSFARDDWWLHESNKYKPVSAEEEASLSRDKLIEHNLRFAISVAKQYAYTNIPIEDLIQYANIGLVKAADLWDPTRGFKFISYAVWWIRQTIMANVKNSIVSMPVNQWRALNTEHRELEKKSQKDEFLYDSCVPRKVGFEDWMVGSYEEEKGTMYTFEQLISKLTKREQDIIRERYVNNRTQCDIAESMGCTRENVRSIESKALRKLRRMLKHRDL